MVSCVVDHLDLKLPDFDIVGLFDRVFKEWVSGNSNSNSNNNIGKDLSTKMVKQGIFLLQCMIKWYVTTGSGQCRRWWRVDDLAGQLNVAVATCKLRYKELLKCLVDVARANLPWGDDGNVKNIMINAQIVLQYIEVKSMCNLRKEIVSLDNVDDDLQCLVSSCLNRDDESLNESADWEIEDLEKLKTILL
ncbi:putative transcription factor TFIIB [Helianthus anomalus]